MLQPSKQIENLALLMGGDSPEADISRQGAERVSAALTKLGIDFSLIDVVDSNAFVERLHRREFANAFNLVHGEFGEGGALVALLERFGIAHTGVSASSAMLCFDKHLCKSIWRAESLPTPDWLVLPEQGDVEVAPLTYPLICKPSRSGSSLGVEIVEDSQSLAAARRKASCYGRLMVEDFIDGREYTTGIIQGKLLPTIELVMPQQFYDYQAKYLSDQTQYLPAPHIDADPDIMDVLERAGRSLRCQSWARIDFIYSQRSGVQLLEINSVPGMSAHSLLPKAGGLAGYSYEDVVAAIVANIELDRP